LNNGLVLDLAKSAPRTLEELAQVPYLGEKRARLYGMELIQLLSKYP
jgi:ribonuclease D